jgi:ligand-binding sensor domain-containing protein
MNPKDNSYFCLYNHNLVFFYMKYTKSLIFMLNQRMSFKSICLTLSVFLFSSATANGPVALGQWRVHLPYNNVLKICETPDKIYCASENGLFTFNYSEGSTERLSPANGFSGYKVQAMAYDQTLDALIIAYNDSKIEIVRGNAIEKNDDIFRKTIIGQKTIHHIQITDGIAYISTSFGLLELNIVKNEIRNSYLNIGPLGTVIDIYSSCVAYDSLYISTKTGIYKGSTNPNVNLADFTNWSLSKSANIQSKHIANFNQNLYAELDSQIYIYKNKSWEIYDNTGSKKIITNIEVNHNNLIIGSYGKQIYQIRSDGTVNTEPINILNQAILDKEGNFWYASPGNGLVFKHPNGEINYYPNGPKATSAYNFTNAYDKLWVMAGSFVSTTYAPTFNGNKYYNFDNFEWRNSNDNGISLPLYDFTVSAFHPIRNRLYIGTHGTGILQLDNGVPTKVFNETNSPLEARGGIYTIISGLAIDSKHNLWVSNFDADSCLKKFSSNAIWTSYKLPIKKAGKIVIDSRSNKWIVTPQENSGLLVFNDKNTDSQNDDETVILGTNKGNGNLPTTSVNDIAFTKSGELLIGTDQGFVRIRNPNNVFNGGDFDAQRIIVSVEANSNLGGYLLGSEIINCIVVDGGDRRWFGTNKGAWLYDSDGETLIHHFTTENSPLMSNNIEKIGIMESTGEVFFGTEQGIASFRSDALPASNSLGKLTIYPNPVRPEYNGDIAITGTPDNTLVKITDINGSMVYQTYSNGGMATWNGKTFDGTRCSTGVYLVFCINADGSETTAGKILFIN